MGHAMSKVIRFTPGERQSPKHLSNLEKLEEEYNQFLAVAEMLIEHGIILRRNQAIINKKKEAVWQYMRYSQEIGIVTENVVVPIDIPLQPLTAYFLASRNDKYGQRFKLTDFIVFIKEGSIKLDDGTAVYGTNGYITPTPYSDKHPKWATHVIWYPGYSYELALKERCVSAT